MSEKEFEIRKRLKDIENIMESNNKKKIELRNELFKLERENFKSLFESLELIKKPRTLVTLVMS